MNPFGAPVASGMLPGDLTAGTPSNLGRVGDAGMQLFSMYTQLY